MFAEKKCKVDEEAEPRTKRVVAYPIKDSRILDLGDKGRVKRTWSIHRCQTCGNEFWAQEIDDKGNRIDRRRVHGKDEYGRNILREYFECGNCILKATRRHSPFDPKYTGQI